MPLIWHCRCVKPLNQTTLWAQPTSGAQATAAAHTAAAGQSCSLTILRPRRRAPLNWHRARDNNMRASAQAPSVLNARPSSRLGAKPSSRRPLVRCQASPDEPSIASKVAVALTAVSASWVSGWAGAGARGGRAAGRFRPFGSRAPPAAGAGPSLTRLLNNPPRSVGPGHGRTGAGRRCAAGPHPPGRRAASRSGEAQPGGPDQVSNGC